MPSSLARDLAQIRGASSPAGATGGDDALARDLAQIRGAGSIPSRAPEPEPSRWDRFNGFMSEDRAPALEQFARGVGSGLVHRWEDLTDHAALGALRHDGVTAQLTGTDPASVARQRAAMDQALAPDPTSTAAHVGETVGGLAADLPLYYAGGEAIGQAVHAAAEGSGLTADVARPLSRLLGGARSTPIPGETAMASARNVLQAGLRRWGANAITGAPVAGALGAMTAPDGSSVGARATRAGEQAAGLVATALPLDLLGTAGSALWRTATGINAPVTPYLPRDGTPTATDAAATFEIPALPSGTAPRQLGRGAIPMPGALHPEEALSRAEAAATRSRAFSEQALGELATLRDRYSRNPSQALQQKIDEVVASLRAAGHAVPDGAITDATWSFDPALDQPALPAAPTVPALGRGAIPMPGALYPDEALRRATRWALLEQAARDARVRAMQTGPAPDVAGYLPASTGNLAGDLAAIRGASPDGAVPAAGQPVVAAAAAPVDRLASTAAGSQSDSGMPREASDIGPATGVISSSPGNVPGAGVQRPFTHSSTSIPPREFETLRAATPSTIQGPLNTVPGGPFVIGSSVEGSTRKIYHAGRDASAVLAAAHANHAVYVDALHAVTQELPGVALAPAEPGFANPRVKTAESLAEKLQRKGGVPAQTMPDLLGGRLALDNMEDADRVLAALEARGWRPMPGEGENFLDQPKPGGYRGRHVQLIAPDGRTTAELQLIPREIAEVQNAGHALYDKMKRLPPGSAEANTLTDQMRQVFANAWDRYLARRASESGRTVIGTGDHAYAGAAPTALARREVAPPVPMVPGAHDVALFPDGTTVRTHYAIVDAASVRASHSPISFDPTPGYPAAVQGRAYHGARGQAAREHVVAGAATLRPMVLVDAGRSVTDGPPLITPDGVTIAGNGRVMMLQRAAAAHPAQHAGYIRQVTQDAARFGVDPGSVHQVQHPMLVRVVDDPAVDHADVAQLAALNRASDTPTAKAKDPLSDATTLAARLTAADAPLAQLAETIAPDETLRDYLGTPRGRAFATQLVEHGVIPRQDVGRYVDVAAGRVTPAGADALARGLLATAVPDAATLASAPPSALQKLEHAVPPLVAAARVPGWALDAPLTHALQLLTRAQATGQPIDDVLAQTDPFAPAVTRDAEQLARLLATRPKAIVTARLRAYAEAARHAADAAHHDDLFGHVPESPDAAAERLFTPTDGEPPVSPAARAAEQRAQYTAYAAERRRAPRGDAPAQLELAFGTEGHATAAADRVVDQAGPYVTVSVERPVLSGAERGANVRTAAERRAWVDLRGQRVTAPEDVVQLLAPFRDPQTEKLHVLLVDRAGRIASHTLETSGAINYVAIGNDQVVHRGRRVSVWAAKIEARARRLGATRVLLAHNHPSGNPTPSAEDHAFTREVASQLAHYGIAVDGHYVLDHGTATVIAPHRAEVGIVGTTATRVTLPSVGRTDDDWTAGRGPVITSPEAVHAAIAGVHRLATPGAGAYVLHLDTQGGAVALVPHRAETVAQLAREDGGHWLTAERRALGAKTAILLIDGDRHPTLLRDLADAGARAQRRARQAGVPSHMADIPDILHLHVRPDGQGGTTRVVTKSAQEYGYDWNLEPAPPDDAFRTTGRLFERPGAAGPGGPDESLAAGRLGSGARLGQSGAGATDPGSAGDVPDVPGVTDREARAGAVDPRLLTSLAGAGLGGAGGGALGAQIGQTPEARRRNALLGAALGASLGGAAAHVMGDVFEPVTTPAMTAAEARAMAHVAGGIDFDGTLRRTAQAGRPEPLTTRLERLGDQLSNSLGPIERLGIRAETRPTQNPRDLLSYAKSSAYTIRAAFREGVLDPVTREVTGPSFQSIFAPLGDDDQTIRTALAYLVAKRVVGRGVRAVAGDAASFAQHQTVAAYGDGIPAFQEVARRWQAYTTALGDYAVKSGLWPADLWARLQASDALYVPFSRIQQDAVRAGRGAVGIARRYSNVGPGVERFQGSMAPLDNPAVALAEYTQRLIARADRYRVGAALFDAVDALGPAGAAIATPLPAGASPPGTAARNVLLAAAETAAALHASPADLAALGEAFHTTWDPKNPVLWRHDPAGGGQKQYVQIHAPELYQALMALNANESDGVRRILDATLRPLKRVFTAATTGLSPRFSLATNPVRDVVDALAKTQSGLTLPDVARGYREAIAAVAGRSDVADEALRAGLGHAALVEQDRPNRIGRTLVPVTPRDRAQARLMPVAMAPVAGLERLGEMSDQGPRLAEYLAALRQTQHLVDAGQWTVADQRLRAATLARGVTVDFANRPGDPVAKLFADYVPFFGASMNAGVSMLQAAARNPARVAAVGAGIAAAATVAWAMKHAMGRAEEINDRPATERGAFLLFPVPGGAVLRVPLGQELGVVAGAVTSALDALAGDDPHATRTLAESVSRALPPGMQELWHGVPPLPVAEQVVENAQNETVYGSRPVVPRRLQDLPPAERRYATTAPTFDLLADAARHVGVPETSPLQMEHLVRGITSSATPLVTAVTDPIASAIEGRDAAPSVPRPIAEQPWNPASTVLVPGTPSQTQSEQDFYALLHRSDEAQAFHRQVAKTGDHAGTRRLTRDYADVLAPRTRAILDATRTMASTLQKGEARVRTRYGQGGLSADEAQQQLTALRQRRQLLYRRALAAIRR